MAKTYFFIISALFLTVLCQSCYNDNGNYNYSEVPEIVIDTTGVNRNYSYFNVSNGDEIIVRLSVKYDYPEDLTYAWLLTPYPYQTVVVGNTTQYPAPDTISTSLNLEWKVNLEPGGYRYYFEVRDKERGLSSSIYPNLYNNINVVAAGSFTSLMCLQEFNGNTDIGRFYSSLALVFTSTATTNPHFYSEKRGEMIPGKPSVIGYCSRTGANYYYAFTDMVGYRLDYNEFMVMEDFNDMFYSSPVLDAGCYVYESSVNRQELFINNGKLHVLNNNQSNDRKFSSAVAGVYDAFPYITLKSSGVNANPLCVVFDKLSKSFMRYYPGGTSMSRYGEASSGAYVDVNNLPNVPVAIMTYDYYRTCAVVKGVDGKINAHLYNFFSGDDTNLSGNGSRSIIDLSGCEDIDKAVMFYTGPIAKAFHYVTDKAIYAFSITSGETFSHKIYDIPAGEVVTCIHSLPSGGFPTAGRVYWFATWNEAEQDGKIIEFEIDPDGGLPSWTWGAMLGINQPNPNITGGFGKIISMKTPI